MPVLPHPADPLSTPDSSDRPPARASAGAPAGEAGAPRAFTARERFLRACAGQPVDRTPVWLMRQAGRVLPEYRALKERHTFLELVRTPELATEVTLQPIRRFGFDAAILFSDILVIPEALGQSYEFRDSGGVRMAFRLSTEADIARLDPAAVPDRLGYVAAALQLVRRELDGRTALIGFSGAPWTLANFMVEGGSSESFGRALEMFSRSRSTYEALAARLTDAIIRYLQLQCEAGAEVLQIFDTLAHRLPAEFLEGASTRWIREIVGALGHRVPIIVFAKGAHGSWKELVDTGAEVLGFDGTASLARLRAQLPARVGIQGNLPPETLLADPAVVIAETRSILETMRGRHGHLFNLGHGVPPGAPLENIHAMLHTIRTFS